MRCVACCSLLITPCTTLMACECLGWSSSTSCRHLLLAAAHRYLVCASLLETCSSFSGAAAATSTCLLLAQTEMSHRLIQIDAICASQRARAHRGLQVELGLSDLRRAYAELHEQLDLGPERRPPEEQQQIKQHVSPC